ncbi:MAG: SGNH/GDSL hydrolase family protein [Phormidesmis sp.]
MATNPLLVEAENMVLSQYFVEDGKGYITLPFTDDDTSIGTASASFTGPTATYDIVITYFDENDGNSQYTFSLNDEQVGAWTADKQLGSAIANNKSKTTETLAGIELTTGDTIQLTGKEDLGELGRIDSIQFVPIVTPDPEPDPEPDPNPDPEPPAQDPQTPPPINNLFIEAEDMLLDSGFVAKRSAGYIELPPTIDDSSKGSASAIFNGPANTYDIIVTYFDEKDGKADFSLNVNGSQADSWTADGTFGNAAASPQSRTTHTISSVSLATGDALQVLAQEDDGELGRIDSIKFVPATGSEPEPPTQEPPTQEPPTSEPPTQEPPASGLMIEAEDMQLSGAFSARRNVGYIQLAPTDDDSSSGTASTTFSGPTDTYDIVVTYFDEKDGKSDFALSVNGTQKDSWTADGTFGNAIASDQSRTTRTISNVALTAGDTLQLFAQEDDGELGRIDSIKFVPATGSEPEPPTQEPPASGLMIEAEDMQLSGAFSARRNVGYIQLAPTDDDSSSGTASTTFSGPTDTYDIVVTYFDEKDGKSDFALSVNGTQKDSWTADGTFGNAVASDQSRTTRTISNVALTAGDTLQLFAQEDDGELGRIDSIEFVKKGGQQPDGPLAGSNGVLEIMPLGASITRGAEFGSNGKISNRDLQNGYRDHLSNLLKNNGVKFDFVGSQTNGSGGFDQNHEGHGGWKISQIASNITSWLGQYKPEIILLNIGTNDMLASGITVDSAAQQLSNLIDTIVQLRPASELIVSSIGPTNPDDLAGSILSTFSQRVDSYNDRVSNIVANKISEGKKVRFADVGNALNSSQDLEADGFHPNDRGNQKIADVFYGAIDSVLSETKGSTARTLASTSNVDPLTGTISQSAVYSESASEDALTNAKNTDVLTYSSNWNSPFASIATDEFITSEYYTDGSSGPTSTGTEGVYTGLLFETGNELLQTSQQSANLLNATEIV